MPKPSNFDELYPGRFLKAGLFKGAKPTLTIKDVEVEELEANDGKKKAKGVISFAERPMELCLNKTNGLCIKAMFGKELKDWIGKRITLFASQWDGEECIRVWGSPDIAEDSVIKIELARKKPFTMTMHAVKVGAAKPAVKAPTTSPDPRVLAAWELLGWKREEGEADMASNALTGSKYLAHLNALLDEVNTNELAGELVP
jgi:hypothetical protein